MYQLLSFAAISLGAGVLAACGGSWPYPPPISAVRPLAWASPQPSVRPARKPGPSRAVNAPAPEAGAEVLAMTEPASAMPAIGSTSSPPPHASATDSSPPQASRLIGLDQPAVTRLLGARTQQFEQPPALVWRYKNATCELDLFFLPRLEQQPDADALLRAQGGRWRHVKATGLREFSTRRRERLG